MNNLRILYVLVLIAILPFFGITQIDYTKLTPEEIELLKNSEIDNMSYWRNLADHGIIPKHTNIPIKPAKYKTSRVSSKSIEQMSTDICVLNGTGLEQTENSIFIDPNDDLSTLNSNNSGDASFYGANYIHSTDGGQTWSGSKFGAGGTNRGDPAACIDTDGREYVGYIATNWGQGVAYSDNGTSWTAVEVLGAQSAGYADKNHLMVNNVGGSYNGYIYSSWYHKANNASEKETVISRSTDHGVSWSTHTAISTAVSAGHHNQGVNIQIGPAGQVYAVWAIYDTWGPTVEEYREDALGFARSLNGGASYYSAIKPISNIMGIRTSSSGWASNLTGKSMRVNSFPTMAVDVSGGPYNGYIYVAWTNIGTPGVNTGTNVSIYTIRSTNGGVSWSSPIKVNQGSFTNDKAAYFPWLACDPVTGKIFCVFYDDRNFTTTSVDVETWVAYSEDGGLNWEDFVVSDVSFTPSPSGSSGYMGDYLGIAAQNNWVYPCWTDNRSGTALTYVSPIHFSDYCIATGGCDEYISNVQIGTINNSSNCEGYDNFTNLSTNIAINVSEELSVTIGDPFTGDDIGVWVDWNRDGDFTDPNEEIGTAISITGTGPYYFTVAPPSGTTLGNCTMRIRLSYSGSTPTPCGTTTYGEVEDYTVNVTGAVANVWDGSANHYWHQALNWSLGRIPIDIDPVVIPNVGYQPVYVDDYPSVLSEYCASLTVESGATLEMRDQSLTIDGNMNISGELGMVDASTANSVINVMGNVAFNSGSTWNVTASSSFINVYQDWNFNTGANANATLGFVDFRGTTSEFIRCYSSNSSFYNLRNYKSGGAYLGFSGASTESLVVNNLTFITSGAIFNSYSSQNIVMKGAFNYYGPFDFSLSGNTGSVIFDGINQTIYKYSTSSGVFNNIVFSSTTGTTIGNGDIVVANNITIEEGNLNPGANNITLGGNWTNTGGVTNPGTGMVIFESSGGSQYVYGTCAFYDVQHINTGQVMHFMGPTTINHDLNLEFFCWSNNTFAVNGTLNVDNVSSKYTANAASTATIANVDQGGQVVCNGGNITVNNLVESYIQGYWSSLYPGGVMNIYNGNIDVGGSIHITDGTINLIGVYCYIPFSQDASLTMSGGVLDVSSSYGIRIDDALYAFNDNITGGVIRTNGYLHNERSDFTPTAGTFELYGSNDVVTSQTNGGTFYNLNIDKEAKGGSVLPAVYQAVENNRGEVMNTGAKANNVNLTTNYIVTNNLTINSGELTLNGYELTVINSSYFYGTLNMNNPADVYNSGVSSFDQFMFYNGSSANLTAGNIYLSWGVIVYNGALVSATTGNTIHYNSSISRGGIANDDPNTVFGNIDVNKPSGYFQIWTDGNVPIVVDGDFNLAAGNEMEMQNLSMIVHGNCNETSTSAIYLYDFFSKNSKENNIQSNGSENGSGGTELSVVNPNITSGTKGGALEIDTDFALDGLMDIFDGDVLIHGNFDQPATGSLIINGGSLISDAPTASIAYLAGSFNMGSGLFEITFNPINFYPAFSSISDGIIRCGGSFISNNSGSLQPTGGSVELIGNGSTSQYIQVHANNYFHDLTINRTNTIQIYTGYNLRINNDFTILSGGLNTNGRDMYVGGTWDNTVGTSAFIESTGKVVFTGPGPGVQYINSDETFNVLENNTVEAIRINSEEDLVECNSYNWISGGVSVHQGTFIANDLAQGGIYGNWYALSGSEIYLYQDAGQFVDMYSDWIYISGGMLKIIGGADESYWCSGSTPLTLDIINGGVLDFDGYGVTIFNTQPLTETLSSGSFKTSGWFACNRPDFNPAGGVFEFYGGNDGQISIETGSTLNDILINKSGGDKSFYTFKDRDGNSQTNSKANRAYLFGYDLDVLGNIDIDAGTFDIEGYTLNCYGDANINDGGILNVNDNSVLALDYLSYLYTNSGGILNLIGSPGNEATITHISSSLYSLWIEDGGIISAEHALFEYMSYVYLRPGSTVDPIHSFHNCTFQNGSAGNPLMVFYNTQDLQINNAVFPTNTWGGPYNVRNTSVGDVTFYNASGGFAGQDYEFDDYNTIHWITDNYQLDLEVFLQGPFNPSTTKMDYSLNNLGLIPTNQPFNSNPLADWYYTGSESVGSIPSLAVDWILVELRDASDVASAIPGRAIARQAGFVTNTGMVLDLDGLNPMEFNAAVFNNLYVTVWHRNHLGVISANPLVNVAGTYSYNFMTAAGQAYGSTSAQVELTSGLWGILSGDGNGNGFVGQPDKINVWEVQAGETGYQSGDFNLDGQVNNPDKDDKWYPNFGAGSFIPE